MSTFNAFVNIPGTSGFNSTPILEGDNITFVIDVNGITIHSTGGGGTGGGGASVSNIPYDATTWDGVTTIAPSKNAVRDFFETLGSAAFTSSSAYDASGAAATAQSNAEAYTDSSIAGLSSVYDPLGAAASKVSDTAYDATTWNGVTTVAPSKNAVRDYLVTLGTAAFINFDGAYSSLTGIPSTFAPSTHASSHASGGGDPITIAESQVTNLTTDLAAKAPLASPTLTGTPAAPTASGGTNTTQIATTAFVQAALSGVASGLNFKGVTDCSTNPNYPSAVKGDLYIVSVAGKIGGGSGISVEVGDWYLATADNAGGTEASVGTSWGHMEHNLVGALLASNNLSDLASASTARTNLGLGTLATQSGTFSGTSSGTNTGDQTNISGNAATVTTNANLTGEVTSTGNAAVLDKTAITNRTADASPDAAADYVLTYDASATALKKVLLQDIPAGTLGITSLSAAEVAVADEIPEYNASATANKKITVAKLFGLARHLNGHRVTPQTGVSKIITDSTAVTTLYLTPHESDDMCLYDGTRWVLFTGLNGGSDLSVKLTDAQTGTTHNGTKVIDGLTSTAQLVRGMQVTGTNVGAAAVISSIDSATQVTVSVNSTGSASNTITFKLVNATGYNLFLVYNAGTPRLQFGAQWSGNTQADSVAKLNGVLVNTAAVASGDSNSIPANQGRLVATMYTSSTVGQTQCKFGGTTSQVGGSWLVANVDNQESVKLAVIDTTDSWAYGTDTVRQANGSTGNQCEFVLAKAGDEVTADLRSQVLIGSNVARPAKNGCGVDSTNAFSGLVQIGYNAGSSVAIAPCSGAYESTQLAVGYHFISWLEKGADGTSTFEGDNGGNGCQSGMYVTIKA